MMRLPPQFLCRPIAHRGYHDDRAGRPENSLAAVRAAVARGYGVELDVQLSRDGRAMVFHDYHLSRLTGCQGTVRQTDAQVLSGTVLGASAETIPTLAQALEAIAGRVPILIEIKDQDGALGPSVGPLERAVADALAGYGGDVAVMSFNPHSVAAMRTLAPTVPRGLATERFTGNEWRLVPEERRAALREIPDFDAIGAGFVSHRLQDLPDPRVRELRRRGWPVLCWTVRSRRQERIARQHADNITFEGYAAEPRVAPAP